MLAVQLCWLRYPGRTLASDAPIPEPIIQWVASQALVNPSAWATYGERDVKRREPPQQLLTYLGLSPFSLINFRALVRELTDFTMQPTKA